MNNQSLTEDKNWTLKESFLLAGLSLFLLSLSFVSFLPFYLSHLSWISLVPWFLLLRKNSLRRAMVFSFFLALLFFAGAVYWITLVTPEGYVGGVLICTFYVTVFSYFGHKSYRVFPLWGGLFIPFLWLLAQYGRATFFFTRFPWYMLGYAQVENDWIIQSADLWGIFGVTLVVVWVNLALSEWAYWWLFQPPEETRKPRWVLTIMALALLGFTCFYSHSRLKNLKQIPSLTITIVQANIPLDLKSSGISLDKIQGEHMALTRKALSAKKADLVLWPETMLTLDRQNTNVGQLRGLIKKHKQPMLVGAARMWRAGGRVHYANSVLYFGEDSYLVTGKNADWHKNADGKLKKMAIYDKIYLVPLSEYIPFRNSAPSLFRFLKGFVPPGFASMDAGAGAKVFTLKGQKFSPSICFEISFPELSREAVQKGAHCLINLSNDAWFKSSAELDNSRFQGRVRAIETRRAVVRCINGGISCFISARGTITDLTDSQGKTRETSGLLTMTTQTTTELTIYVQWGDWIIYVCLAVFIVFIILIFRKKQDQTVQTVKDE